MSWRRPSNASSRVSGPWGPVSAMLASASAMGRRRRAAAIASPSRVCAFSRTRSLSSSAWKAARSTAAGRPGPLVAPPAGPPRLADSSFITVSSYCSGDNARRAAAPAPVTTAGLPRATCGISIGPAIHRVRSREVPTSICTSPDSTATAGHVVPAPTWPQRWLSLWLCRDGLCCCEGGVLALEGLDRTAAPALGQGLRRGIGEDVFLSVLHAVEDGSRDRFRGGLGYVEAPGHIGVGGAGQDRMHPDARSGEQGAQRLGQVERGRFGDRVGGGERQGGDG